MNRAYRKNIWRTIGRSRGRYFAIMAIIALGVGFFSGLKVTKPSMLQTGNTYLREHKMYDFRLISTYGFDDDEVAAMEKQEGVLSAEGSFYQDFIYERGDGSESVMKAISLPQKLNTLELCEGRFPEADNECVLDAYQFGDDMLGQEIMISDANDDETKESFQYDSYTVVGLVNSPLYMNTERGTTSLGNGRVGGFVYLPLDGFVYEYYKEMYLLCQEKYDIYTKEYEDFIEGHTDRIKEELKEVVQIRYEDLKQEIAQEYDDAVEEIRKKAEEELTAQVTEQVKQEMYAQLMQTGLTESVIDGMFETGQLSLPQDTIDETVAENLEETVAELVDEIELPELEEPEIYVLDRTSNTGYVCYDNDTNIVDGVAKVFPIFFFLIAALVCSTTMTRMVDDERGQIGTFRALGYENREIMAKYMIYSGSSALIGCLAGFFGGSYLFPCVIWSAYRMMYNFGDGVAFYFSPFLLAVCIVVSLLCSMGTTYIACKNELRCMPADLIRPKAPAAGKRIFLEKIGFIWKPMKFLHKVTARNVFRFKKRMLMMVLGIAGCTALVLTGFGVKDSISNLAAFQYDDISTHDIEVTFSSKLTENVMNKVDETLEEEMEGRTEIYNTSMEYHLENGVKTLYVIAAEGDRLDHYMNFNILSGDSEYPQYGEVMISEKIAELGGISVGDPITITDSDAGDVTLTVSAVYENYVWHYAYMTPETFEDYFGKKWEPNTMLINTKSDEGAYEAGAALSEMDEVMNVLVVPQMKERVSNMMSMLDAVVWLVIGCAGALAFIVLFNLSNINITERVREIATIKVLGFYAKETGSYVFRENLVLTIMGIVVGLPLGVLLHRFVMQQIQVDIVAFKVAIFPASYFLAVVTVLLFLMVVDLVMRRKLETINMAESLKSIE